MKLWKAGALLVAGVTLVGCSYGCSSKITMVRFNVEADNGGKAALGFEANGSTLSTETAQRSSGELAAATEGAQAALDAIRDARAEYKPDLSKKDSENQTTTTTTTNYKDNEDNTVKGEDVKEEVDTGVEEVSDDLEYKNKATFKSYGKRNGDRYAWRIAGKGPSFGEPIKMVFSSGKTYVVKDTDKNCRGNDPDNCDLPSDQNKDGFVFKPGIGPNGEGDTNTGTSHGGIYLQGPYGDSSQSVTLYYNKPE